MRRPRWLRWPWAGVQEAKQHLKDTQADRPEVEQLYVEVEELRGENHITQRMHKAMRGGRL